MSMRLYLSDQYHPEEICPAESWADILGREAEVASYRLVQGHFRYNLRELVADDAKMLVVLRDPLRRTVSALRHLARDPNFHHTHERAKNFTLSEMIRDPEIMSYQRDVQARFLCASQPAAAVSALLREAEADHRPADAGDQEAPPEFQLAADRLETIDYVGVTEKLDDLLTTMADGMHFHPPLYFPVINDNPEHIDPLHGLIDEELDIVREHNMIDTQVYEFAGKLLEWRRFERAMKELLRVGIYQVPPGSFRVAMDEIVPGSGWYSCERDNGQVWRWTGPGSKFSLGLVLRHDADYRFVMTFHDPRPEGPGQLTVEINDFPVDFAVRPEGNAWCCDFVIDRALLHRSGGLCLIRVATGPTVLGRPPDQRLLGILVRQMELICLDS